MPLAVIQQIENAQQTIVNNEKWMEKYGFKMNAWFSSQVSK